MLPAAYQLPAAIVLLFGGIVACFFGYRLFRIVLAIFGFILGALAASSVFGASDTVPMLVAAIGGGLVGAGLLIAAYFVGVALVGAGLGALVANLLFSASGRDPQFIVLVLCSVAGAVGSMYLQRYVIIIGTGFGGAWTMIVGAMALIGQRGRLGGLSTQSCPRPALGAICLGNPWFDRHRGPVRVDWRRKRPGRSTEEEGLI
jgi:hypothetical protein